ncbi:hypothetical protein BaRGS_00031190 [Batillaria attramentaria]|uniref:DH domain-containing protein n=1 Tax=Batillaria attramentaria TaxID=370345 RepID=A0ABD0JSC6_9CAEN
MLSARSRLKELAEPEDTEDGLLYADSPGDVAAMEKSRKERRRRKIIRELFETEKAYLHHLELIHKYFYFPLRFNCILPEDAHAMLFSNVEQIKEVNRTLLELMEQSTVGQAFHHLGPFLKLYSMYANNHEQALTTLQEWMQKSPEFAEFIRTEEARPEVMGLKINALLITPVQRIPRYKLLLEDLLQHTPIDHHDYQQLKEATKQIADIAMHINEHIRQHENFQKMLAIQKCFDSSAPKILQPGRVFLKEGPLKKVSRKGGKSFERMFFLFNDVLLYGKPRLLESGGRSYTCCCVLPIKHCKLERVFVTNTKETDSCAGGVFKITCKEESLLLYSDTAGVAQAWSETVEKAIRKANDDRQTLRKPSSHKIPLRGRSLRKHRQQQKKTNPGLTPVRRKSVRRKEKKEECCSPQIVEMRRRIEPFRERIQSWYDNLPVACASPPRLRPDPPSEPADASMRLSVVSDISEAGSEAASIPPDTSVRLSVVSDGSEAADEGASASGSSQRSSASAEDIENFDSFVGHNDLFSVGCDSPHMDPANSSIGSTVTTSTGVEVYYPRGSQLALNVSTKSRSSVRTKLKSYLRRPFTRLQRARQDVSRHCSPFTQRCSTLGSTAHSRRK